MAFATYEDLEARWRPLSEDEQARATVLLEDAATYLLAFVDVDPDDEQQASALKMVSCSMVQRAMTQGDSYGIDKLTMSADIYSQSVSYVNPSGDFYLTASEKRLLGITSSYMLGVRPVIDPVKVVHHEDIWRAN